MYGRLVPRDLHLLCNPAIRPRPQPRPPRSNDGRWGRGLETSLWQWSVHASSFELRWRDATLHSRSHKNFIRLSARAICNALSYIHSHVDRYREVNSEIDAISMVHPFLAGFPTIALMYGIIIHDTVTSCTSSCSTLMGLCISVGNVCGFAI